MWKREEELAKSLSSWCEGLEGGGGRGEKRAGVYSSIHCCTCTYIVVQYPTDTDLI